MHKLRYRQIHLDFHTSPEIPAIGAAFDKRQWQEALKVGHVNSVTCFAVGHHGWSYNDTEVGVRHPHLTFDLLRAQFEASKELDINVPIYLTAGISNRVAYEHPEWREVICDGSYAGWTSNVTHAGFHKLCFNSPYLAYLCELIAETVELFPGADGLFLDIINQGPCCCRWCLDSMAELGLDAKKPEDRATCAELSLEKYYRETTAAAQAQVATMPVFHNSGNIRRDKRDILKYFTHLELESLPTGGWGYDHFPLSAKYCAGLGLDYLGMTGKFHTTWGEFGGYKHPNALRYECATMLALGAKCSVGDQPHPSGAMDESTYAIIGKAYAEVEEKESWCVDARNVADIGLLSCESVNGGQGRDQLADTGACRILLEEHFLFDVIDPCMSFDGYKMLVLPDELRLGPELVAKLEAYLAQGGRLFLTGTSGVNENGDGFLFDIPAQCEGRSPYQPDYVLPSEALRPSFLTSPLVMYLPSQRIKVTGGESLGSVFDPYFNRDFRHFCSHQHAPPKTEPSGYDVGVSQGAILYLAHPVFSIYGAMGAVAYKEYAVKALRRLLAADATVQTNLPSTARLTLTEQAEQDRCVLHLLYANTVQRGSAVKLSDEDWVRGSSSVEVIEELLPLRDTEVALRLARPVKRVTLEPQGVELAAELDGNDVRFTLNEFACHQMVVLQY